MKLVLTILLVIILLLLLIGFIRKRMILSKISSMSPDDKTYLLNELIAPFGFYYNPQQDIFSTRLDAWQREFGYTSFYDKSAVHFHMIFDNLPIYFHYQNRTWLLELWKGQYGISTGCEIGLYYADGILSPDEYSTALFQSVTDNHMINMSFLFCKEDIPLAKLREKHWWLTAFSLGKFSKPSQLSTEVILTFPTPEMAKACAEGLQATVHLLPEIYLHRNTLAFLFTQAPKPHGFLRRVRIFIAQSINRFWCAIYNLLTRPFTLSLDKTLYLYYQIPFIFRKLFRIRRYYKRGKKGVSS